MDKRDSVLVPIAFFSLFNRPLTIEEVVNLSYGRIISCADAQEALEELVRVGLVEKYDQYFGLVSSSNPVEDLKANLAAQERLWQQALSLTQSLSSVPFVKMVAVSNSLALGTAHENSDIDLFFVAEPGFLAVARDHLLWKLRKLGLLIRRPVGATTGIVKKHKVDVGLFVTTEGLDISPWRLGANDIYFDYWSALLVPILDREETYRNYWQANSWIFKNLPNLGMRQNKSQTLQVEPNQRRLRVEGLYRTKLGKLLAGLEHGWQARRLGKVKRLDPSAIVEYDSNRIRQIHDRRPEYQLRFENLWNKLKR